MREVVLYTREGCSLCEKARTAILAVRREVPFHFREVDIGWSGDLYEDHKHDIPVIEIDGRRAFKHRVDAAALREKLASSKG
jgi:glutaredoxin